MGVKDIITELFEKITLDGRGYNKSASISVATHEDADHLDIEVTTIYISFFNKYSKTFLNHEEDLSSCGVTVKTFSDDLERITKEIQVKDSTFKEIHSSLVTVNYKGLSILCIGDLDMGDLNRIYHYISRKFSKLHAVIIPYHGSVKPFTHGNRGAYDLQKAEERLSRDIKRMGIPVFFMQHFKDFDKLPKTKQVKIEGRLIPVVHKTLQFASELSRNKNMENFF